MRRILLINGSNLNLLGRREPGWYGDVTLSTIELRLKAQAGEREAMLECFQSNPEHELVNRVQALATAPVDYAILNPGAFTHTSIALRDALLAVAVPFIEVHLSNVHAREPFRRHYVLFGHCGRQHRRPGGTRLRTRAQGGARPPRRAIRGGLMDIRKIKKLIELLEESGLAKRAMHACCVASEGVCLGRQGAVRPAPVATTASAPLPQKQVKVQVLRCRSATCKGLLAFEETDEGYLLGQVMDMADEDGGTRFFPCPKCGGRLLVEEYVHRDGKVRVRVHGFQPPAVGRNGATVPRPS